MAFTARPQLFGWLAIAAAAAFLLWLLSPILAPFLLAAILAYILNPLVERLTRLRLPRTLAALAVMLLALAALVALLLVVLPLFYKEGRLLAERLPAFLGWLNERAVPWVSTRLGFELHLDIETLRQLGRDALQGSPQIGRHVLGSLKVGGLALVGFFADLVLVPVVLFYLMRDWRRLLASLDGLLPPRARPRTRALLGEVDGVLAEFLRGQLVVILVMSSYYVAGLWLAGLEFALPVGLITGVLVFVPYVGAVVGLLLGTVAALLQFDSFGGVAAVWAVFAVGQALEGMAVTPLLVGERIGLHPVAVIFALLAFGQLFGFFGVLLALPASAALLVGLRHLGARYVESALYRG